MQEKRMGSEVCCFCTNWPRCLFSHNLLRLCGAVFFLWCLRLSQKRTQRKHNARWLTTTDQRICTFPSLFTVRNDSQERWRGRGCSESLRFISSRCIWYQTLRTILWNAVTKVGSRTWAVGFCQSVWSVRSWTWLCLDAGPGLGFSLRTHCSV